ncbi:hypothetical protein BDQ17DRAFT_1351863 [Cyathus striatus]|nr:hypothetical protein BDQ17DRAFT_1351863 [Cyathus striatus]
MRQHVLRVMQIDTDKELPDSHQEGIPLGPDQPIRFVWDKTTKQSVHNARMKARVIADIKENRRLYKHVPKKDFGKKQLDGAFEASYTTFRAKYKAQRDNVAAESLKRREEAKSRKSRHLSRRKAKLANRADARMNIQIFQHETFGSAMQLDCMSSEESDFESDPQIPRPPGLLRTRGYAWRSTRLVQFYCMLDDEERADKSGKPKRGSGKRERCTGPPKEGFHLPPNGVASWMISRRWYKSSVMEYPDLGEKLQSLIHDPSGFDWDQCHDLGVETEDEEPISTQSIQQAFDPQQHNGPSIPQHHYTTNTSSLNYALV